MSFGYERQPRVMVGDSVDLSAFLYTDQEFDDDETLVPASNISSVDFYVRRVDDAPTDPLHHYTGELAGDGEGKVTIPGTDNPTPGQYHAVCTFSYGDTTPFNQKTRSIPTDYDVVDPFERTGSAPSDPYIDLAWARFEDLFDSEQGGPWLRDQTLGRFDKTRMRQFVTDVLFDINNTMPASDFDETGFPYTTHDGSAVFTQGIVVHSIRHLIRSYTEQPDTMNSPVAYLDRKRYLDAWSAVYNIELQRYNLMLEVWKRRYFAGGNKLILGSKQGRGFYGPWRTRGIWPRGY